MFDKIARLKILWSAQQDMLRKPMNISSVKNWRQIPKSLAIYIYIYIYIYLNRLWEEKNGLIIYIEVFLVPQAEEDDKKKEMIIGDRNSVTRNAWIFSEHILSMSPCFVSLARAIIIVSSSHRLPNYISLIFKWYSLWHYSIG